MYWFGYVLILLLGLALLGGVFFTYHRWSNHKLKAIAENLTLVFLGLFVILMAVEFYFKLFFAQTDGYTFVLAAQNWHQKYWYPVNSFGYRDREWTPADLAGKTKVMVVGDSLAAGTGIKNYEDRFSNQLGKLLGPDYVIFNVASPGWSTQDEIRAIIEYPYIPDLLILAYFVNDIERVAYDQSIQRPKFFSHPGGILGVVVNNSYAFNFLYWRWYRWSQPVQNPTYLEWVDSLYQNQELWWRHQQELLTIIEGAASEQIPLVVIVFPNLADVAASQAMTRPVIDFFQEHHTPVLDVSSLVAGHAQAAITVNAVDAHPNELVNELVAEQLYLLILQLCLAGQCHQ